MRGQIELGGIFRCVTLCSLACAWFALALSGASNGVIAATLALPGVVIFAPLVAWRRNEHPIQCILIGCGFLLGWLGLAAYLTELAIFLRPVQPVSKEPFAGLDEVAAAVLGVIFAVPAIVTAILLYRSWMWSMHDAKDRAARKNESRSQAVPDEFA